MTHITEAPGAHFESQDHPWPISKPWFALMLLAICLIWGNSLVPGEGSGSMSLAVLQWCHGALQSIGLPYEWLTHYMVRKGAHFCEYLALAVVAMQAYHPHRMAGADTVRRLVRILVTVLTLIAVPSIDESIQYFVSIDRSGQLTDVLIDCSGAATGALLTLVASAIGRKVARR